MHDYWILTKSAKEEGQGVVQKFGVLYNRKTPKRLEFHSGEKN